MFWRKKVEKTPAPEDVVPAKGSEFLDQDLAAPLTLQGIMQQTGAMPVIEETGVVENTETPSAGNLGVAQLEGRVIEAMSSVFDPEIPVNIYELGLIYDVVINAMNDIHIDMTLTSPACPVAGSLPGEVEMAVRGVEGVGGVHVELVWEPPWTPDRMSEAARLELGFM